MAFDDLNNTHNPATGTVAPATWGDQVRDNFQWLANDHPRCQGNRTSAQSISDATDTAIAFSTADTYDIGGMHDTATNNTRFTVPSGGAGLYDIRAYGEWAAGATGSRTLKLRTNGATVFWQVKDPVPNGSLTMIQNIAGSVPLVATDYIELVVIHGQGTALNFSDVHLAIRWVAL
jgi:hypothetical protein